MLRVVLIGYGELASSLMLGVIESRHKLAGILTWEKAKSNKLYSAIKDVFYPDNLTSLIKSYKIPEIRANGVNSEEFIRQTLKLQPDVFIIGSWGEILKKNTIIIPKIACVNCHPSLLPEHRGSNPYTSAIRQGETRSGITFHLVDEGIDTGPILLQKEVSISNDDTGLSLKRKCTYRARESVKELLDGLENAFFLPQEQDESKASYFPRINEEDAKIDWNNPAQYLHNQIRGLNPWIKCYTRYQDQFLMIGSSKIIDLDSPSDKPGKILSKSENILVISTLDPKKAIQIGNLELYGFPDKYFTKGFIAGKVKINDYLKEV